LNVDLRKRYAYKEVAMDEILTMLEKDSRLSARQVAVALGRDEATVRDAIAEYEANGTIMKYTTLINKDNLDGEHVTAMIEVKIAPQLGDGYDRIAQRIYLFDEVDSLYLMTGSYDLLVTMTCKTMKDAAQFVYERLAAIEGVTSTATRFVMKKYKEQSCVFVKSPVQEERINFI
jgi:DNA-binding Lrp family transcriptional regulator